MRPASVALATLLITALAGAADAPVERTEILGTVPTDLVGRWFAVAEGKTTTGLLRPIARAWEIRRGPEHLELVLRRAPLPKPLTDAIQAAATAKQEWHPQDADLRAVAESWNTPPATETRVEIQSRIAGADGFTPEMTSDAVTQGAELAVVIDERFDGTEHVARTTSIYGVRRRTSTRLEGTFVGTTVAIVFTAVPITFTGDFTAYRLDGQRSWLDRLFAGCRG